MLRFELYILLWVLIGAAFFLAYKKLWSELLGPKDNLVRAIAILYALVLWPLIAWATLHDALNALIRKLKENK